MMTIRPTLEEAKRLAADNKVVPIALEMFSDVRTSIQILRNIRAHSAHYYILESITGSDHWGRYSFLGYDPTLTIHVKDKVTTVQHVSGGKTETVASDPIQFLRNILARYKSPHIPDLPPFTGGLVGFFSYEFVQYFQPALSLHANNIEDFPDLRLMLMDKVIAFDHYAQKIYLIANVPTDDLEQHYIHAVAALKDMERMILTEPPAVSSDASCCGEFSAMFSREAYAAIVQKVKAHIAEGDIFQAVVSNRFTAEMQGDLLQTYRVLRTCSPSPYMVYLHFADMEIVSASPETLVSLRDGKVATFPLAGTCKRGATEQEDLLQEAALLADPKERAEHDMLVDLGRNDLGKVSAFGSVKVEDYQSIKRFSHVSHIASHVTGQIADGMDAIDALAATLPAGTLSGAPKKRACEIIDALEGVQRGVYGGAMGYIDFTGNMDFCIGIRMAVLKNGKVHVQAGAGIVADSIPEKEYEECLHKACGMMTALGYKA